MFDFRLFFIYIGRYWCQVTIDANIENFTALNLCVHIFPVITVISRVIHYIILSQNVHFEHRLPSIVWHSEELMISTFTTLLSVTTGTIWSQHESQSIRHRAIRSLSLVPLRAQSNNVNCNWRSCDAHETRVHYIIKRWWLFSVTRFSAQ